MYLPTFQIFFSHSIGVILNETNQVSLFFSVYLIPIFHSILDFRKTS